MLSTTQERKLRFFRGTLVFGWLLLIVSLFWDPITPLFTMPDHVDSPFRLQERVVMSQGVRQTESAYPMANRIFWTMIIPLLPLFFMVTGHETWRRICPLSFISQIPRYLGIQRKKSVLIRRTGKVERQLALISRDGWLKRNVWYVQFGLLFAALNMRILFINSDRFALAMFFIAVIAIALTVGYLWGGKTWCNYFCPIAIVQKIYTEPGGIFESKAHLNQTQITQSMCRTTTKDGERSTCVGCTANCPDIDLERSYWENINDPSIRHVYYAFLGLVVGFYTFYFLYSGNWDYYFSGIWTHEADQIGSLFKPGLYIEGYIINIPKIISAPLVLALFVGLAVALGKAAEWLYRWILTLIGSTLTEAEIINRCLSFCAFITINIFYLFGGRPNLLLFPSYVLHFIDSLIAILTTLWLLRATQRSPTQYRRESLANSLSEQLRKLKIDISKYLEGRKLEQLKPDEIYILAKTLPAFSHEQRLTAYRNIMEEAIRTGKADTSSSIDLLRDVRIEIGVTEDEHRQLLQDVGIDDAEQMLDKDRAASYENWLRKNNYRQTLEPRIITELDKGLKLADILQQTDLNQLIIHLREQYQISEDEHQVVLSEITGIGGMILDRAKAQLETLRDYAALKFELQCLIRSESQLENLGLLLIRIISRRTVQICIGIFPVLSSLGDTPESSWIARSLTMLAGSDIDQALSEAVNQGNNVTWAETIGNDTMTLLQGSKVSQSATANELPTMSYQDVVRSGRHLLERLVVLTRDKDSLLAAIALHALTYLDVGLARETAALLEREAEERHWLFTEEIQMIIGTDDGRLNVRQDRTGFTITSVSPNGIRDCQFIAKEYISVGRAPSNDVTLLNTVIFPYHLGLWREKDEVWIRRSAPFAPIYMNGQLWHGEKQRISGHALTITFVPPAKVGPMLMVEWTIRPDNYTVKRLNTLAKLLLLSQIRLFQNIELSTLADIAKDAEVRHYKGGTWLCRAGEKSNDAYLIQAGSADVISEKDNEINVIASLGEGAIVGELGVITGKDRTASVRVAFHGARIVTINGTKLRALMERDPLVAFSMLTLVAGYVSH